MVRGPSKALYGWTAVCSGTTGFQGLSASEYFSSSSSYGLLVPVTLCSRSSPTIRHGTGVQGQIQLVLQATLVTGIRFVLVSGPPGLLPSPSS